MQFNCLKVFVLKDLFIYISCVGCFACKRLYAHALPPTICRGQKRALDALELESKTVVSCHVVLGIEPESSGRAPTALDH